MKYARIARAAVCIGFICASMASLEAVADPFTRTHTTIKNSADIQQENQRIRRHAPTHKVKSKWTLLIIIHACNDLESFAYKNLRDMMKIGSNNYLNILVELHKSGDKIWRYKIEKSGYITDEVVTRKKNGNVAKEVVDAMKWAVDKSPADKYALVFWNHGCGVQDPSYQSIAPYYMKHQRGTENNPRTTIPGITTRPSQKQPRMRRSRATKNQLAQQRGILFDDDRQTYLTNQGLKSAVKTISEQLLNGKKIDFVGMDACNMAMVGVAYQMKKYVKQFTGSQEFEFGEGWPYHNILQTISTKNITAEHFGTTIVNAYSNYFEKKTHYYTQSSINIEKLDLLKENIDQVVTNLLICKKQDPKRMRSLIQRARSQCLSFSFPEYIDLHSFYHELERLLNQQQSLNLKNGLKVKPEDINNLKHSLRVGGQIIQKVVTANKAGRYLARAKGLSIYFPTRNIDASYARTDFCKESLWLDFIHDHLVNR